MSSHHMEAQLIGYIPGFDGHPLRRGIAINSNGFQGSSCGLNVDAVAGFEGELKDALVVQRRNPEVRDLGIPFVPANQSTDPANTHQTGIHFEPNQAQAEQSNQLKPKGVLSAIDMITDREHRLGLMAECLQNIAYLYFVSGFFFCTHPGNTAQNHTVSFEIISNIFWNNFQFDFKVSWNEVYDVCEVQS